MEDIEFVVAELPYLKKRLELFVEQNSRQWKDNASLSEAAPTILPVNVGVSEAAERWHGGDKEPFESEFDEHSISVPPKEAQILEVMSVGSPS